MITGWRQVLDFSAWFGVQSGLDESILIFSDGGVQEVNSFGVKVIVTLELYGFMENVQEINKDKKFFLRPSPKEEDVINVSISSTCGILPKALHCNSLVSSHPLNNMNKQADVGATLDPNS